MYEVNTIEEIDDPRLLDAEVPREAALEYAYLAINEGWWDDIAEDGKVVLYVRPEDGGPKSYYRCSLTSSTKVKIRRIVE